MNLINRWIVFFLMIPHFNIYYLRLEQMKPLTYAWQFAVVPISLFLILKEINAFNLLIIFHTLLILLSGILYGTYSPQIFYFTAVLIGFSIYISHAIKYNPREFLRGLYYLFNIIVVVNFVTMLMKQGIAVNSDGSLNYFIGGKNAVAMTVLPAITIAYLYSHMIYKKLKILPRIIIIIGAISMYLSSSGTGVIISLLAILFIMIPKKGYLSFNACLSAYIVLFFTITIFRLQEVFFSDFITNVLKKDITFTGRTYLWDFVLSVIKERWILGYGRGNFLISTNFTGLSETHNGVLEVLMYSGAVGLLLFLTIVISIGKQLSINKNNVISKILSFSIFAYLIIGLTESVFYKQEFWLLLVISYSVGKIVEQINNVQLNQSNPMKLEINDAGLVSINN